jgi:hypothetical protein
MSEDSPFFSAPYQGSDAAHPSASALSAEPAAYPSSLAAAAESRSPTMLASDHRLPRSSAAAAQQLSPSASHSRHAAHSLPCAAGAGAIAAPASAAPAAVSLRGSRGASAKHASGPPQPPLVADGTVCGNALCASPFALGATWLTRTIPGRGAVRLCAGCACEVDKRRVCEVCREIYVAAKATPQSTQQWLVVFSATASLSHSFDSFLFPVLAWRADTLHAV